MGNLQVRIRSAPELGARPWPSGAHGANGRNTGQKTAVVSFLPTQHRYNAACTAAPAATSPLLPAEAGRRVGAESPLDDTARAKLRNQARVWLEAELASWSRLLETAKGEQRASITKTLQWWQQDTDLAGIRGSEAAAVARA